MKLLGKDSAEARRKIESRVQERLPGAEVRWHGSVGVEVKVDGRMEAGVIYLTRGPGWTAEAPICVDDGNLCLGGALERQKPPGARMALDLLYQAFPEGL